MANKPTKTQPDTHALTLRLPIKLHARLRRVAFHAEESMTQIVLRAIETELTRLRDEKAKGAD